MKQLESGVDAGVKREPLSSRVFLFLPDDSNFTWGEIQKLVDNSRDIDERPQGGVQTFEAGVFTGSVVRGAEGIKTWTATHIPRKEPKTFLAALNAISPPRAKSGDSLAPPSSWARHSCCVDAEISSLAGAYVATSANPFSPSTRTNLREMRVQLLLCPRSAARFLLRRSTSSVWDL